MTTRQLALAGIAAAALVAAACGGRGGASDPGLLIYRDTFEEALFAVDVIDGERFRLPLSGREDFPVSADCTRDGQRLAFAVRGPDNSSSLLTIEGEGADEPLEIQGLAQGIAWSPDERRIALSMLDPETSVSALWLLDPVSGESEPLPSVSGSAGAPRWSPDGESLVFAVASGSESHLFRLDIGSSAATPLIESESYDFSPDWSPDGSALLFARPDEDGVSQVWVVDADGGDVRQLTTSRVIKSAPRWSVDGSMISFAALAAGPEVSLAPSLLHNLAVWVANADGTDERSVTGNALDVWPLTWCLPGPWLDEGWVREE